MKLRNDRPLARVMGERSSERQMKLGGHSSYSSYLASTEWRLIRSRVLSERPHCEVCGKNADQVHHDSYDELVMAGAVLEALVSICRGCHVAIEFDCGEKRGDQAVRQQLRRLLADVGNQSALKRLRRAKRTMKRTHAKDLNRVPKKKVHRGRSVAPVIRRSQGREKRQNVIPGVDFHVDWTT